MLYLQIESILIQISINLFVVVTNASTTTVTVTEVPVMSPKDFEEACKQPVIIGTVVSMAAMVPVNFIGMFAMFSKLFNVKKNFSDEFGGRNRRTLSPNTTKDLVFMTLLFPIQEVVLLI